MVVLEAFTAEIRLCNIIYCFEGPLKELPTVCVDAEPSLHWLCGAWFTPTYVY
jgi:hypothetical protein